MAKYRRYRKYTRRRHIWSSRLQNFSGAQSVATNTEFVIYYNLCSNPVQSQDTVSQKYTVKNISCQMELATEDYIDPRYVENLQAYICFIPQGYIPTGTPSAYADVPYNHPEWIMAHRYFGSCLQDMNVFYPPLRLRTRLARKLDTGDRIVLIILGKNTKTETATLSYQGIVKYVTKAN